MLYVTTREKNDAYTVNRVIVGDYGPDGGVYLPFRMPLFTKEQVDKMAESSFGQIVADILNLFFSSGLTAWDVDSAIGKNPVKVVGLGNRIQCAQLWQNLDGSYKKLESTLAEMICRKASEETRVTSWLKIAIRISMLFATFSQLQIQEDINVGVPADDFALPMAVWYSRQMGLPVGRIICGCRGNDAVWDLLHLGQLKLEKGQEAPCELERLVHATLGTGEAKRFAEIYGRGGSYKVLDTESKILRAGMFAAVISDERIESLVPSVYRTNSYTLAEDSATGYAALMDYRAKTGSNRDTLLLEDAAPKAL